MRHQRQSQGRTHGYGDRESPPANNTPTVLPVRVLYAVAFRIVRDHGYTDEVVEDVFVRGLTHDEAARVTGLPLGTIKSRAQRGLTRLQRALG